MFDVTAIKLHARIFC